MVHRWSRLGLYDHLNDHYEAAEKIKKLFEPFGPLETPPILKNPPGRHCARDLPGTTATLKIALGALITIQYYWA